MLDAPTVSRFSLAKIPQPQRHETMREAIGRTTLNVDFTPLGGDPEMELATRFLTGVTIADALLSSHRLESGYDPSRDSDDFALLWSTPPASGVFRQLGKETRNDGSAVLISCADRYACETHNTFHHVTVILRRSMLCPLLPDAEAALMRVIPADNETLRLLNSYLAGLRLLGNGGCEPEFAHMAATHIADLVALAVGTNRDAAQMASGRGLRAARLDAVKRWVLVHLSSPKLSIGTAAVAAGLSPRSVQMLFEAEGTTFTSYVLTERLALAYRRLAMPRLAKRTIGEIAYDCGFGDLSYFTKSFRRVYDETPSDVRRRALVNRSL
jgi:AraC-like DNA-binding protein